MTNSITGKFECYVLLLFSQSKIVPCRDLNPGPSMEPIYQWAAMLRWGGGDWGWGRGRRAILYQVPLTAPFLKKGNDLKLKIRKIISFSEATFHRR